MPPQLLRSTLTAKYVMAATGIGLMLFVLGHLAGNLLLFLGPDYLNGYAHHLKASPLLLWPARIGLLVFFVVHILVGVRLSLLNLAARPTRYQYEDTRVATRASRTMLATGLITLLFVLYHLAHFTFGIVEKAHVGRETYSFLDLEQAYDPLTGYGLAAGTTTTPEGTQPAYRPDVYTMVVVGFRHPFVALIYLAAMIVLWFHLWHGASSWCQSVGLAPVQQNRFVAWLGPTIATLILVGNGSIVLAVLFRLVGVQVPEVLS